jgi:hypothetical protein
MAAAICLVGPAAAQELTTRQQDRLEDDPAAFLEAAATATHWFGDPRGLDAAAVRDYVAAMRASRRADVTALLLQADLSDDGAVTMDEVQRLAPGLTPSARGKLIARAGLADADGEGTVSPAELQAYARAEALRLFPDQKAQDLQLILLFDNDDDGWVRYEEVVEALKDLTAARPSSCGAGACRPARGDGHRLGAAAPTRVVAPTLRP